MNWLLILPYLEISSHCLLIFIYGVLIKVFWFDGIPLVSKQQDRQLGIICLAMLMATSLDIAAHLWAVPLSVAIVLNFLRVSKK
jgi:hypothetical protein